MNSAFTVKTIAIAHTPFNEKFGIPRQAGLVNVPAVIELLPPFNSADAVSGLEDISHLWLTFIFSENIEQEARLKVRPPRLGGNKKIGVFATRSSFRPNAIGQSLVKLERVEVKDNAVLLHVTGIDLLNGTPIIDIKPYLPYADNVVGAFNNLAPQAPDMHKLKVQWSSLAQQQLFALQGENDAALQQWISEVIQLDPRPAYKSAEDQREYGMAIFNMNIRWQMLDEHHAEIIAAEPLKVK